MSDIPKASQSLKDILKERFTLKDLIIKDKIANERKSLKDIILEMEDEVLANAGVDVFEEVFKLIFTKLEFGSKKDKANIEFFLEQNTPNTDGDYGKLKETLSSLDDNKFRVMEFRNTGQTDAELKNKIQGLFDEAKDGLVFFRTRQSLTFQRATCRFVFRACKMSNCFTPTFWSSMRRLNIWWANRQKRAIFTPAPRH